MKENEEYLFFYEGKRIVIKTGKHIDADGGIVYFANANFKNLYAVAECPEKALENCVRRVKFAVRFSEKKITLMKQEQAEVLAKKYFEENYTNKAALKNHSATLSYEISVEDEIFKFIVYNYNSKLCDQENDSKCDAQIDVRSFPDIVAFIYVNLLTGECDMIENKNGLK